MTKETKSPEIDAQEKIDAAQAELAEVQRKQRAKAVKIAALTEQLDQDRKCLRELPPGDHSGDRRGLTEQLAGIYCEPQSVHSFQTQRAIFSRIGELDTIDAAVKIAKPRLEKRISEAEAELATLQD